MNKAHQSEMEGNEMSVLLKYYIQKVCAKIKSPALSKKSGDCRKNRNGGENGSG
jgi:hypothetical protein